MWNASDWHGSRGARSATLVLALALLVAGCYTGRSVTGSIPNDYRERHPIRLTEGERSIQLLVGSGRGDLTAAQRAQVTAMAGGWLREGTGPLVIDVPSGTPNARAANYAAREVQSLLRAVGVPARAIATRSYHVADPQDFGPLRIAYARIEAHAGPCGEWPEDLGAAPAPSLKPIPPSIDNRPYWNFGCATQRNLAAAVANPEDLVQPRAETPPYAPRRQQVLEHYRKGEDPSTRTESGDAVVSAIGPSTAGQ